MKRFLLTIVLALTTITLMAQFDYPVVERNGRQYYEYRIQKGDGLYAIGKKFGVTQAALFEANPGLKENIREGDKLYIPIKTARERRKNPQTIHVVENGETPYIIAKRYNITLDSLLRNNVQIRNGLIHPGDTLVISYEKELLPAPAEVRQKQETHHDIPDIITVKARETLYSISKQYSIAIHDIIDLNPGIEITGLKAGMQLRLRKEVALPAAQESATPAVKKEEPAPAGNPQSGDAAATVNPNSFKIAYILPLTGSKGVQRMFIEFYRGSLIALERLKNEKRISNDVEVWCWDTRGERAVLDSILRLDELKQCKVVIGPGFSSELEPVLTWCKANNKKVIVPFSSKIDRSLHFANLYQFNPAQEWWWERSFNFELQEQKEKTHFIIGRCGNDERGNAYANTIEKIMRQKNVKFTDIEVNPSNIDSILKAEAHSATVLLLANSNGTEVRPIIEKVADAHLWNVTVWGFGKWGHTTLQSYDKIIYGSLFYDRSDETYDTLYRQLYKMQAVGASIRYDLLGYDITMFALGKKLFMQSEFDFEMIDGRWLNTNIYKLGN